jgi:5-formyltetrahydrofolate cyclo-ligase
LSSIDANTAREQIWKQLRKVARPDSRFAWQFSEFIADYEGSDKGAAILREHEIYKKSAVLFVTPDNNMDKLREYVIRDKKVLLMTNYGITRGVFVVRPGDVPPGKEELASLLDGIQRFWHPIKLAEIKKEFGRIDMLVTGASAITTGGIRFGKGHGYFDIEWAMFYETGVVGKDTPVFAMGHDCQVVDLDVVVQEYDTVIDYIVTPTRVLETRNEYPKPSKGIIWDKLEPGMLEQIAPLKELREKDGIRG